VAEAVPLLGPRGVVTGWGGMVLLGAGFVDGRAPDGRTSLPVAVVVGPGQSRRARPGIRFLQDRIGPAIVMHGVPLHHPPRLVVDEMRLAVDLESAVVAADAGLAAGLVTADELADCLARHAGWDGVPQARRAAKLADGRSASPPETRLRLAWVLGAGLPRPQVNPPVFSTTGRLLGYPDLLDEEAGLAIEYDGADHRRVGRQTSDNRRERLLREHGLDVERVTILDLLDRHALVAQLRAARARAVSRPQSRRTWTLQAPRGWRRGR
jgi:hypothetical protein